jgi:hypothetical protein
VEGGREFHETFKGGANNESLETSDVDKPEVTYDCAAHILLSFLRRYSPNLALASSFDVS